MHSVLPLAVRFRTSTDTPKLWDKGSGEGQTVVIPMDMPLHPDLL